MKIDTVWPDQVASVYEWMTEKEKELFSILYLLRKWMMIHFSFFPGKISTRDLFTQKNTSTSERIFDVSPAWNFGLWSSACNLVSSEKKILMSLRHV